MGWKSVIRRGIEITTGYTVVKKPRPTAAPDIPYDQDGLRSFHNHDFVADPAFARAYARGCRAAADYHWQWRVHIGLWAARAASRLDGDFVECGVNRGFLSSAIMTYLDWDTLGRTFYLLDTFAGMSSLLVSPEDTASGALAKNEHFLRTGFYVRDVAEVTANFSEWKNVRIVQGAVPETLAEIISPRLAFLHLDMNSSPPEIAALTQLWDRLVPGAIILFDDYAYSGYESQKRALDGIARQHDVLIASLPTGQGLLLKPPA